MKLGFNGATLLQAWRGWSVDQLVRGDDASMGPRFFKRGEDNLAIYIPLLRAASMGPRFFKRGESDPASVAPSDISGFNGATLLQAWRVDDQRKLVAALSALQWGHASSSVERPCAPNSKAATPKLQWGHASSSVERQATRYPTVASNMLQWGHASSSVERLSFIQAANAVLQASMGPRFFKRGERGRAARE